MKLLTLSLIFLAGALLAGEQPKPAKPPVKVPEGDVIKLRDAQLAAADKRAAVEKARGDYFQSEAELRQLQDTLQTLFKSIEKRVCAGGPMRADMTCGDPPKPDAEAPASKAAAARKAADK